MRRFTIILLAAAVLLAGCSRKGVIPERKMKAILYDMYLVDAQIAVDSDYAAMADTTSVYGAVFAQYGYTPEDFRYSMDHYLSNPVKFKEMIAQVYRRMEKETAVQPLDPMEQMKMEEASPDGGKKGKSKRQRKDPKFESPTQLESF